MIPIEEIARFPAPGMSIPVSFAFSPTDRLVTYLHGPDQSPVRQLYAMDVITGESRVIQASVEPESDDLSLEEQLLRQRQRQLGQGIVRYGWAAGDNLIQIPAGSGVYVKRGADAPARLLIPADDGPIQDPRLSPDGSQIAYVQDAEIYVASTSDGESQPRRITHGARGTGKTHGLAEYIAQEEMHRMSGFWWSPDGSKIAFTEVDETHIPVYRIVHQGRDDVGATAQEDHRYPFAGQPNARVRLAVVPVSGGEPVWMDLGDDEDIYLARVNWMRDGGLVAQIQNREQTRLDLIKFDVATGKGRTLLTETSGVWINLHDMFKPLSDGGFVWASEKSGYRHLYVHDAGVKEPPLQLTSGEWMVDSIEAIDHRNWMAYFTATKDGPTERHLYRVSLDGGEIVRLTPEPGTHIVKLDYGLRRFVDIFSDTQTPPTVTLRSLNDGAYGNAGDVIHTIHAPDDPRLDALELSPPELVSVQSRDGETLRGALYRPLSGDGPYPTVIYVYGGPHAQVVTDSWGMTCAMRIQYLRSLGYAVFSLDNRGAARRGLAFEGAIKRNMGDVEVRDQVDGVRWLVERGIADPSRVGVYGWSYGGYMTLMCLARAPEVFKMGVAGAPVTHWDGYDTHYTERYMGTPANNPGGYETGSPMSHVAGLEGALLIVHGLIDENVHFRHTARLVNALIKARKPYELLMFPDERHMPRSQSDREYMEERITDFFRRNL